MNEENNYDPAIHTLATDKIKSKLVNLMFAIEDTKKQLKTGIYGGVTREEMYMVHDSELKEKEIYEYILDSLDDRCIDGFTYKQAKTIGNA